MRGVIGHIRARLGLYRRDESAGATMEFVIGLPLLFIAMVFVYEFSSLFWAHHIATSNVRSAVRYLSRAPLAEPYLSQAANLAQFGDANATSGEYDWMAGVTVTVDDSYASFSDAHFRTSGDVIRVRADVPYTFQTFGLLNSFSGGSLGTGLTLSIVEEARHYGE